MTRRFFAAVVAWLAVCAAAQTVTPPPVAARAYALVDATSGQTLASAAPDEPLEPGSLTKLMTEYLVFEAIRDGKLALDRAVPASVVAAGAPGARMYLSPGQSATVAELLRGMIVLSANDAAVALAEAVAG